MKSQTIPQLCCGQCKGLLTSTLLIKTFKRNVDLGSASYVYVYFIDWENNCPLVQLLKGSEVLELSGILICLVAISQN